MAKLRSAVSDVREGRSSVAGSLGGVGSSTASQKPIDPRQRINEKRFDGDGKLVLTPAEIEKMGKEARQAVDAIGQSSSVSQGKGKVKRVSQHALAAFGFGKGPSPRRFEVMNFAERARTGANTETEHGPTPALQPMHGYLDTRADVEVAAAGIHFAEAAAAGDEETSSNVTEMKKDLAAMHEEAAVVILAAAREQRKAVWQSLEHPLLEHPKLEDLRSDLAAKEAMDAAVQVLFDRLDLNGMVVGQDGGKATLPDVLASKTLADAALRLFRGQPKEMCKALEGLCNATCKGLVQHVANALNNAGEINTTVGIVDPLTRLAVEICSLDGGGRLLAELMEPTPAERTQTHLPRASNEEKEALRVALCAASEMQDQILSTGKIALEQQNFLRAAVQHSQRIVAGEPPQRKERVAYRAVQNGIMSNGSGSAFERISEKLDAFTVPKLAETAKRNARAASGRRGRSINWVSSVAGERTFWRKSNLSGVTADLGNNGMLPKRADAIDSLDKTATGARIALARLMQPNANPVRESLGRMMESVLDAVGLGMGGDHSPGPEDSLKHLGRSFFEKVESAMGSETMGRLPAAIKDAWDAMKETQPNVAHVLLLVNEHLDLRDVGTAAGGKLGTSLVQRGAYTDKLMLVAMDDFERVAKLAQTVAEVDVSEGGPDRLRMADLAVASHAALVGIQKNSDGKALPSAARLALRIDVLEAIEYTLATQLSQRTGSTKSVQDVMAAWPEELRQEWAALKRDAPDAGRLMRLVFDKIHEVARSAGDSANDEVDKASASLANLQDDVHINRFEMAVADAVTTFNDVRCGRDATAAMRSLTYRFCLGEKVRAAHGRQVGLDVGRNIKLVGSHGPLGMLSPSLGASRSTDSFLEMSMTGATLQMFIGDTESTLVFGGFSAGFRGMLGMDDHEINKQMDMCGLALRLDAKWEATRDSTHGNALVLRIPRVSQQEDQMRREMGDILCDLVRDDFNGHRLEELLDRHSKLSVADVQITKKTHTGESSAGIAAILRRGKKASRQAHDATGYGVGTVLSARSQRQNSIQTEMGGDLKLEEFKMSAQQRTEFRAGLQLPESLLPSKVQHGPVGKWADDTKFNPQVQFAGIEYRKQIMNSGVESTVRMVTHKGVTVAQQTQQIREFEDVADFLKELGPRQHQYLTVLANTDPVPGASAHEKLARAHERLKDLIDQAEGEAGPNMTFTMVTRLRDEMGRAYDMLCALVTLAQRDADAAQARCDRAEAQAQLAEDAGRHEQAEALLATAAGHRKDAQEGLARAANHRKDAQALLLNDSAWMALNIQCKSKAKSERSQSASLGIATSKTASETTSLHSFFPLGKHKVGKTPNTPGIIPGTSSQRWSAARLKRESSMDPASNWPAALADLDLTLSSGELSGELLMTETASVTEPRPSAGEQARMEARAIWKAEWLKKVEDHITRAGSISLRGITRSRSEEVTVQWLAALNDKMPAFDELRQLSPPDVTGLDMAAIDSNLIGWVAPMDKGSLSDMLDHAREGGIAAVKKRFQEMLDSHEAAAQKVVELVEALSDYASPRPMDLHIALNVIEAEAVAFAAATKADEEFDRLITTATTSVQTFMDMSENLRRVYREAADAPQRANDAHAVMMRAQDTVDSLERDVAQLAEKRANAEAQSVDTAALDVQISFAANRLANVKTALETASTEAGAAMQRAQALAMEAELSFEAVGRAFNAANEIISLVITNGVTVHREAQKLLNEVNTRSREAAPIIEAAMLRSRSMSPPSASQRLSAREFVSNSGSSLQRSRSTSPPVQRVVSDPETSSHGSGSDSPPVDLVRRNARRQGLQKPLEAGGNLAFTDKDSIGTSTQVAEELHRAQGEAADARQRAEAARLAVAQAEAAVEGVRAEIIRLERARASTNDARALDQQITNARLGLAEAEAKVKAAATEADTADQTAQALVRKAELLIEDWTEIRQASPRAGGAPRQEKRPIPQDLSEVAAEIADSVTATIESPVVAGEDLRNIHEQVADARQLAEAATRAVDEAEITWWNVREPLLKLRDFQLRNPSLSPADKEMLDQDIANEQAKLRKARAALDQAKATEASAVRRLEALTMEANRLLEAEPVPQPKKPKGFQRLMKRILN